MKIMEEIRRAVKTDEKTGKEALAEALKHVALTENEIKRPFANRETLAKKLENAREIDIVESWESSYGSVRSTCYEESGWNETKALVERAQARQAVGLPLSEAEVMSNAFQLLTQAKLFTIMTATYELTPATYEKLFGTFDSPYKRYDHQIPSDASELSYVAEGEEYPEAGITDRFCETKANKFGRRVSLSRETMITDRTGFVVQQCEGLAASAKYREDQLAALCWRDQSNSSLIPDANEQDAGCYFPERTNVPLYRSSVGSTKVDYEKAINLIASNGLLQWDNLAAAMIKLRSMTNVTGQFIDVLGGGGMKIVVPFGLEQRASLFTAAGAIGQIDKNASAGTESAFIRVPDFIKNMGVSSIQVIVWDKLPSRSTVSESTWYLAGDSQKQFRKHQRWATSFERASSAQLGGEDFKRDVIMSVRAGFNAGFRAVDDKTVIANVLTNTSNL